MVLGIVMKLQLLRNCALSTKKVCVLLRMKFGVMIIGIFTIGLGENEEGEEEEE